MTHACSWRRTCQPARAAYGKSGIFLGSQRQLVAARRLEVEISRDFGPLVQLSLSRAW